MKYNIDNDSMNTILAALAEIPFKVASPIISDLVKQYNDQQPKQEALPHASE